MDDGNSLKLKEIGNRIRAARVEQHMSQDALAFEADLSLSTMSDIELGNASYAQVLINQKKKILALRPCEEGARDSFMWCNSSNSKRKAKSITCKLFFAKLVSLMDWNPNYRYKKIFRMVLKCRANNPSKRAKIDML